MKRYLKSLLNIWIINRMYAAYKKVYIFFHKGITAIRALFVYIIWTLCKKRKVYSFLKREYGVTSVRVIRPLFWRRGTKYLKGKINDKAVFIKIPGKIDTTKREITAINFASEKSELLKKHIPVLVTKDLSKDKIVIEELIEGVSLEQYKEVSEEIIREIYDIYLELYKLNICHLDIRPANFIVVNKQGRNKVMLIDFGYALVNSDNVFFSIKDDDYTRNVLKKLGSKFSLHNSTWDDAYSCLMTLKFIYPSLMRDYYDIWLDLNNKIGSKIIKIERNVDMGTI